MNVITTFTVLEDGEPIATFDTFDGYEQAFEHIDKHAVKGRKYQIVKEFATKDEPLLTIDDTGWKDAYRGMWADVDGYDSPNLILGVDIDNEILMLDSQYSGMAWAEPKPVHPRYDLAPVDLTPHPAYLETVEDYQNAPEYTIIARTLDEKHPSFFKDTNGNWAEDWTGVDRDTYEKSAVLAGTRRKVLYWPEEEKRAITMQN